MSNKRTVVPPDVKKQILERVKKSEKPVPEIAQEHGISPQTIYGWISQGAIAPPTFAELSKLRRENAMLLELIGKLTVELSAEKKGSSRFGGMEGA
jgi:transposase-like protein